MTELSDELLVAYVDGQLAKDQSEAVERVLENDEVAAERVHALRAAHSRLETAFDAMLDSEVREMTEPPFEDGAEGDISTALPEAQEALDQSTVATQRVRRSPGFLMLGGLAIAFTLAGAVGGYALRATPDPATLTPAANVPIVTGASARRAWQEDLIIAHTLYGRDTLTIALETQGNADLIGFQLANAIGTELIVPDLSSAGLTFKRAQLLSRDGEALAQMSYLPKEGGPVSLYAHWDKGPDAIAKSRQIDGVSAAEWRHGNITYLLAGHMPIERIDALAETTRKQITAREAVASNLSVPPTAAEARRNAVDPAPTEVLNPPVSEQTGEPTGETGTGQQVTPEGAN